jgi:hypothetical protein
LDFSWEATRINKNTKAIVVPHLVDEDNFEVSTNDHEKLHVNNEDPQELHAENE